MVQNDNLKDLKIALGMQVAAIQKKHNEEKQTLEDKIKNIEKDRAYLQAKVSIETAKINREFRKRLDELEKKDRELSQREFTLREREKKVERTLSDKEEIIQSLNVRAMETEAGLTVEFNQKLRSKEWEIQTLRDEIKILNKTLQETESQHQAKIDSIGMEVRDLKEKHKNEVLSVTSGFTVERGEAEREKYTLQQNIKALKNTIAAMKGEMRKISSEYEDRIKAKAIADADEISKSSNTASELALQNENLRQEIEELRLKTVLKTEEVTAEYEKKLQKLNLSAQSSLAENALLQKSVSELKIINESLKDNYNRKISEIEDSSRTVEVELRNRITSQEAEVEKLENTQKVMVEKFTAKIAELENNKRDLQKTIEKENNKQRELENNYSAQYLTLADEKRHMQEMYDKEIASLKESLIAGRNAFTSMEAASSREKTNLKIEISSLKNDSTLLNQNIYNLQNEHKKELGEKDAQILSLNMLVKEREKEAAGRFAEVSQKYHLLAQKFIDEKKHMQEMYDKEIVSLKEALIAGRNAFSSMEAAAAVEKTNLKIEISSLENDCEALDQNIYNLQNEHKKELGEKDAQILSLNMLVKEREKEAAGRFAEISQKYHLLAQRLADEEDSFQKTLEAKESEIEEQKRIMEEAKINHSILYAAQENEKKKMTGDLQNRLNMMKEELEARNRDLMEQAEKNTLSLQEREKEYNGNIQALEKGLAAKDDMLFRMREEGMRKLREKEDQYSAEIDRLRRMILQKSDEFQREKEIFAEKSLSADNKLSETDNVHKKEIEGLQALRESEKNSLRDMIENLNEKIAGLAASLDGKARDLNGLSEENNSLKSRIESLIDEKRSVAQSLNTLLVGKQEIIDDQNAQMERVKSEFSDMMRKKETEVQRLSEEITRLTSITGSNEEKLRGDRAALENENNSLKEEILRLKDDLNIIRTESEKKNEVLMIEKNAEINKLKSLLAGIRSDLQNQKSESRIAQDELKKHYADLLIEKANAEKAKIDSYESQIAELKKSIEEMNDKIKETTAHIAASAEEFKKEKQELIKSDQKGITSVRNEYEEKILRLEKELESIKNQNELSAREYAAREIAIKSKNEQLAGRIAELKLLRETELGKWMKHETELLNLLKIQGLRMKEENQKSKTLLATSADEIAALKEKLRSDKREYEEAIARRQGETRNEIASLRNDLEKAKAQAAQIYKTSSEEKESLRENFDEQNRGMFNKFNEEKIKMTAELNDIRDINRALEEELASIRRRLETFKSGM